MTVDDLRRALAVLPGGMRVLVEGYEGGLDDAPTVVVADVTMNQPNPYCGNHVWDYEPHESDTIERCVVLPRSDGGVAEGRNAEVVWAAPPGAR